MVEEDDDDGSRLESKNALQKLNDCLQTICDDPYIIILKIKNRFDPDPKVAKSDESCGFRNVSISLILVDSYTMTHSVDGHICELQLQLKEMKGLIEDQLGHQRYVEWRDMLAV